MTSSCLRLFLALGLCVLTGCITITADSGAWGSLSLESEPFTNTIGVESGDVVTIHAQAGSLEVRATDGREVIVTAVAAADDDETLARVGFLLDPVSGGVQVTADMPEGERARLDLVVEVPRGHHVEVHDGSGSMDVRDVASLTVHDGSGSIDLRDVTGSVDVTDGSGSISVFNVGESVTIDDGSGSISVERVGRNVTVDDGSGSISVRNVGGDFTVTESGSGGVTHHGVSGRVSVRD